MDIPLKRALNLLQVILIGVGTTIGATMFAIIGRAIETAGPSIVITFVIGAVFALFDAFIFSELGSSISSGAGGAVSFVKRAFGEGKLAFITGWFDWVGSITDCSAGAIVFGFSMYYFLPWIDPFVLAIITLLCFALINFKGVQIMGKAGFILAIILIFSLGLYIFSSSLSFTPSRFTPLFPKGIAPTFLMVSYIYPTYAGYETITQLSEEVKTAGKTIPRALFLTLTCITIIFISTIIVLIGSVPQEVYVESDTPLQAAANYILGPIGGMIISIGSIIATLSTINGSMAGGTRIIYALSRSGMLPSFLKKVHPKNQIPYASLILTAIVGVIFVLTKSIDFIVYVIALGYNISAIIVALSLIRLRKTEPHLFRPFKTPLYPYTTILAVFTSLFMILTLSRYALILGFLFGLVGLGIFMLLKHRIATNSW